VEDRSLRVKKNHEWKYLHDTGTFVVQIVLVNAEEITFFRLRPAIFKLSLKQSPAAVNTLSQH
jgi:hypothetical protein